MPHFWSIAIHYKEDYESGGVPILPLMTNSERTLYEMGGYILAYVGVAVMSPFFFSFWCLLYFIFDSNEFEGYL